MELPINTLVIILIGVIVLAAIIIGVILPAAGGAGAAANRGDYTLVCNEWGVKDCDTGFYNLNKDRIEKIVSCSGYDSCKSKCRGSGFC